MIAPATIAISASAASAIHPMRARIVVPTDVGVSFFSS